MLSRVIVISLLTLWLSSLGLSQAWRPSDVLADPGPFLLGMAAGLGVHEAGHVLLATANGVGIGLHGASIIYTDPLTDREHLQLASAGFQAQWLLAESLLRDHEAHHPDERLPPFRAGMVVSHLAITAAYLTVLQDHPEGDLVGMADATGLSTDTLALLIAIPAALDVWRLCGEDVPTWAPRLSLGAKGAEVAAVWTF